MIWICAPGGAGKSTLAASYLESRTLPHIWYNCDPADADLATFFYYMSQAVSHATPRSRSSLPLLTPEYLAGIPAFTRRYFHILFNRLRGTLKGKPEGCHSVIVLENFQDVPTDAPFHTMLAPILEHIPDGFRILILSRNSPPSDMIRLQAGGLISTVDFEQLRFTAAESEQLCTQRLPALNREWIDSTHRRTEGWAAGMILMLEQRILDQDSKLPKGDRSTELIFDYIAGELFNRLDPKIHVFLLKSALFPTMKVDLVSQLSGCESAGNILATLHRHHMFTEKLTGDRQTYHFHPLMREFLLNRADIEFPQNKLASLRSRAGELLESDGQYDDAARLFCQSNDHAGIQRLIVRCSHQLLLQGRSTTVVSWLACLPSEVVLTDPWLCYWNGLSSFPLDMPRTREWLERSLELFRQSDDASGVYLAWSGIVDSCAFGNDWRSLDGYIAEFIELQSIYRHFPTKDVALTASSRMLMALTLRKTEQPELVEEWLQRVDTLLQQSPSFDVRMDTVFCVSVYYLWKGEYGKNAILLEQTNAEIRHSRPSPFTNIRIGLMRGIQFWITARYDEALKTLGEALEISRQSGIHVYDSLLWSFCTAAEMAPGNLKQASVSLSRQMDALVSSTSTLATYFFHINSAWHALLTNHPSRADEHLESIAVATEQMGTPYYKALWLIGSALSQAIGGKPEQALLLAGNALTIGQSMKSHVMEWYALLIDAWVRLQRGDDTKGLLSLHRALSIGRQYGFVHLEFYHPLMMRHLCARALQEQIEADYIRNLITRLSLTPPDAELLSPETACLEQWPYQVRIRTLGRFEIFLNGSMVQATGKEQKKPLEMLKFLVTCGGQNVARDELIDALWPDSDGDLAIKSFEMTLGRLRKLLGQDDVLLYRQRQVSINRALCWVDSLALELQLDAVSTASKVDIQWLCSKSIAMYRGHFLPADTNLEWVARRRETIRNRLLKVILLGGKHHELNEKWDSASDLYTRGIEIDWLAEEFHRRLMTCQIQLGNHAEAARIYQRCKTTLLSELGISPSPETTAVFISLSDN